MPEPTPKPRSRWPLLAGLCWLGVVGGAGITVIALVWHDTLAECGRAMLAGHLVAFMCQTFAYHAGVAMVPVVAFAMVSRRRRLGVAAAAVLAMGVLPEARALWMHRTPKGKGEAIKVMSINLMYGRSDAMALLEQIEKEAPDVLVFQEWTREAARALDDDLSRTYPHTIEQVRDDAFGQAVFSKRAFVGEPRLFPPVQGFAEPQITFGVSVDGRTMRIVDVHLLPPVGRTYFQEQRAGAARLAKWAADGAREDRADLLIGDFNAPPRTGVIGSLRAAGFSDAQASAGWWRGTTWPRVGTLSMAPGLQLDHILMRDTVECVEIRTGEDFESDHRPVIARVRWR